MKKRGNYRLFSFGGLLALAHNFSAVGFFAINPAFWSLAVECQIYVLFPLALWVRQKIGIEKTLATALALAIAFRFGVALHSPPSGEWPLPWLTSPLALLFDWLLGAYVAERHFAGRSAFGPSSMWLIPVLLALLVLTGLFLPLGLVSFSVASMLGAICLDRYATTSTPLVLWERASAGLGLISYSFYLWHQPLIGRILKALEFAGLPSTPAVRFAIGMPIVFTFLVILSIALRRYIENSSVELGKWTSKPRLPVVP